MAKDSTASTGCTRPKHIFRKKGSPRAFETSINMWLLVVEPLVDRTVLNGQSSRPQFSDPNRKRKGRL